MEGVRGPGGAGVAQPLERRVSEMEERLRRLEDRVAAPGAVGWARPESPIPARTPAPVRPTPPPRPRAARAAPTAAPPRREPGRAMSGRALEELLGGRLLGWLGGLAVLMGVAFFVAVAISRGWIDEPTRILLAFTGSTALLGLGVWLHERRGGTQASRAMVATAIGSLYLTLTAATQLYDLLPTPLALAGAFAIGAVACAVAVRWDSPVVGGLGIVGALAAPVLVGADPSGLTIGFVAVALASAVGVLVWRRWEWLAMAAFAVTAPQLVAWALDSPGIAALLVVPFLFWALYAGAAIGHELRVPTVRLRSSSAGLLALAGVLAGATAYWGLDDAGHPALGEAALAGLAVAHLLLGAAALRSRRVARPIALLLLGGALTLGDTAYGLVADGPAVAAGWAVGAVGLALAGRLSPRDATLARLGLSAQLLLAIAHTLLFDATPRHVVEGGGELAGGLVALAVIAASAFSCARAVADDAQLRAAGDVVAMAALAYAGAYAFSGPALVGVWAAQAAALAGTARRWGDDVARGGAVAFLGLAALHALILDAPPTALVNGVDDLPAAAGALAAVTAGALAVSRTGTARDSVWRVAGEAGALAAALYLASVAIVSAFQPDAGSLPSPIAGLGVRQQGQVIVSSLWAVVGLGLLVFGLIVDERRRRIAGLGLLVVAVSKVFVYDLAALESLYRVLSLLGCGMLLLTGAFAYQRMRPGRGEAVR